MKRVNGSKGDGEETPNFQSKGCILQEFEDDTFCVKDCATNTQCMTDRTGQSTPRLDFGFERSCSIAYTQFFKVILIGDCNVGKTSIIRRLTKNDFSLERVPTTSVEEVTKFIFPLKPLSAVNSRLSSISDNCQKSCMN